MRRSWGRVYSLDCAEKPPVLNRTINSGIATGLGDTRRLDF